MAIIAAQVTFENYVLKTLPSIYTVASEFMKSTASLS